MSEEFGKMAKYKLEDKHKRPQLSLNQNFYVKNNVVKIKFFNGTGEIEFPDDLLPYIETFFLPGLGLTLAGKVDDAEEVKEAKIEPLVKEVKPVEDEPKKEEKPKEDNKEDEVAKPVEKKTTSSRKKKTTTKKKTSSKKKSSKKS